MDLVRLSQLNQASEAHCLWDEKAKIQVQDLFVLRKPVPLSSDELKPIYDISGPKLYKYDLIFGYEITGFWCFAAFPVPLAHNIPV